MKFKRTKIVATLGPSTHDEETITAIVKAGVDVVRLNFSHGSYEDHALLIERVRNVSTILKKPVAIMQDLQGPKIRVGILPEQGITLVADTIIRFDTAAIKYENDTIPVDYHELHQHVKAGERFLLNDGRIETIVTDVTGTVISVKVKNEGLIISHKGINVPDSHLAVSVMTEKDKADARFGVLHHVDFIALSFVMNAKDILDLRYLIQEYEKEQGVKPEQPIQIIAKIERGDAVKNIKEILEVADGIMVARGDLGIEIPAAEVPIVQKKLIDEALAAAKPVIVATQMLDSMQENPRPTRAEVSDVANAVIDHTDAVMLSNETAVGKYPVETVTTMTEIILETEKSVYDNLALKSYTDKKEPVENVMSEMSRLLAEETGAKLILAASISGDTGRLISRYRPERLIVVATGTERAEHQLNLSWGVIPFLLVPCRTIEELVERSIAHLREGKLVKTGDKIIVVAGEPVGYSGNINLLEVREVV